MHQLLHIVGRAAEIPPRLIDMSWGDEGPLITLVGKGISFDSGGLDIKPSRAMELMKKDMGGAAHVLGLAAALMEAKDERYACGCWSLRPKTQYPNVLCVH